MRRLILFVSLFVATSAFAQPVKLNPVEQDKYVSIPFAGAWLPAVDPFYVGAKNYTILSNLRYTDVGLETIEGYSKINTNALAYTPVSGFHFRKDNESHVLTKADGGSYYNIYDNITAIPSQGNYESTAINKDCAGGDLQLADGAGSFSSAPAGYMLYADDTYNTIWGGTESDPLAVWRIIDTGVPSTYNLFFDETSDAISSTETEYFTVEVDGSDITYCLIGTPFDVTDVKMYVSSANTSTSTMTMYHWSGSAWSSLTITDGTSSGGITLAQTGTVTIETGHAPEVKYINGVGLRWYMFRISAGSANIYRITLTNPIQTVKDVWNGSPRSCISFMVNKSSVYEDYTFQVSEKSSVSAPWVANLSSLTSSDEVYMMFDDRLMGIDFTLLGGVTNTNASTVNIAYWDGDSYVNLSTEVDETESPAGTSLGKSGVIHWRPVQSYLEKPIYMFGKYGYIYRMDFSAALDASVSVDYVTGIATPLIISGYDKVGFYAGRAMLIKKNRVEYSLPDAPWIYNGVNTSDNGRYSLYFGDDTEITATHSLHNRYGSNIIESWVVTKKNETYMLTGSQPYPDYEEPFVIHTVSRNIGCPAPMTMREIETDFDGAERRTALIWLDATGPVIFDGTTPKHLKGIENYFDQSKSECIRYAYMHLATAYVDTIHSEYNLFFPSGSSATANNVGLVYDLKRRKWYRKVPSAYPVFTIPVKDAYGGPYNYGTISTGYTMRLDNTQAWDGSQIEQQVMTGEFSPPFLDEIGLWSYSNMAGVKLLSNAISEDAYATVNMYVDGSSGGQSFAIDLSPGGSLPVARNTFHDKSLDLNGYIFKCHFYANTSTNKWLLFNWGYKPIFMRED